VDLTSCTDAVVMNSVLADNTALFWGGGIHFQGNTSGTIAGNTIIGNDGTFTGGGGTYVGSGTPSVTNNIVAFNTGSTVTHANGMVFLSPPAVLSCNDSFGNDGLNYSGVPDPTGSS